MKNIQTKYKLNFKTMKKGLLTLLAASLVFVGCQNYDDQFDDLNAQISALKSQVDGLSALSGQVASLSGTISGLQNGIAAAQASASAAASSASAAASQADANASAIAAATAAATAAGASADAATAAATAATDAANAAVASGATNAEAIAAATAAATAAGVSADAATAAANAATTAAQAAASETDLASLSADLTALAADVAAVQSAIANASTSAEVAALQAEIDAIELDLDSLLTSNNVYATDITVNSAASMASALALGNKVALMNAAVTISDDSTISDTDIQTFIDRIKTMNGKFTYDSGSATGYAATFDELTAATELDITQAGDISFKNLASATVVTITTSYSTKITSIDMSAMTSVTSIASGADGSETVHNLTATSATNVDLGALTRYGSALTIGTKKGATLDIASLDDKSATGTQSDITLTIDGPASMTFSNIDDGSIVLSNVAEATVSGFYGSLDINAGVETLTTTDSVDILLDGATDLVTATLDFKYDWDPTLTTAQAAVADDLSNIGYLADYTNSAAIGGNDLKTLTVSGELLDLYLDEANLETLTLTGVTMHDLDIQTASDLTTLSVATGNKIGSINLVSSPNLTVADFNHTTNLDSKATGTDASTAVKKSVSFVVTDNLGLTKLHTTGDNVSTFTVTGNDALTELDMTGLKDQGTEASATVNLYDNNLTAVKATNTYDGETATSTTGADGGTADAGTFDDGTSGMDTMKEYLTAIAADADNTAQVSFDTVSEEIDTEANDGTSTTKLNVIGGTTALTRAATKNEAVVLYMDPGSVNTADGAKDPIAAKRAFKIDYIDGSGATIQFTVNGVALFDTTTNGTGTPLAINGNKTLDISAIESAVNLSRASAANVTLDAKRGANSSQTVSLVQYASQGSTATVLGQRYTSTTANAAAVSSTNYGFGIDDTLTLTVGGSSGNSVVISPGSGGVTTLTALADDVVDAWAAKYGSAGTASASAIATVTNSSGILTVTMLQEDSAGYGVDVDFEVNAGTVTATNAKNIDYVIGSSTLESDDATTDTDIIVFIGSTVAGVDENTISTLVTAVSAAGSVNIVEYSTDYTTNSTWAKAGLYTGVTVERTDVVSAEDSVDAAASNAQAAILFNRVTWLG